MPYNGDTFTRIYSWVANAANGIKIRSDLMDADTNDIASGMTAVAQRVTTLSNSASGALHVDSNGNVGVGGSASAWTLFNAIEGSADTALASKFSVQVVSNAYSAAGVWKYTATGGASRFSTNQGITTFYNAPPGTANGAVTWTQALQLDANGQLGIGVTPSAWGGPYRAMEFFNGCGFTAYTGGSVPSMSMYSNQYFNGTNVIRKVSDACGQYTIQSGAHYWQTAPTGAAGSTAAFTSTMTLDSGGNLLIGSSTALVSAGGRGVVEISGSSTAILALNIGGVQEGYVYHAGAAGLQISSQVGQVSLAISGSNKLSIATTGAATFTGGAFTTPIGPASSGTAISLDARTSNVFRYTMTGNVSSFSVGNMSEGQTINIWFTQDGTGSRTLVMSGIKWPGGTAPALSTTAGSVDIMCLSFVGGNYYGTLTKAFS